MPYGAPAPVVNLLKCMTQFQLEPTTNEVIVDNLQPDTDYSVYCYAELMDSEGTAMTTAIGDTRTDISTSTQDDYNAVISSDIGVTTTVFPVPITIQFSQSTQITQSDVEVTNGQVSEFKQLSTTEVSLQIIPDAAGEVEVTLSNTIQSTSGSILRSPPVFVFVYKGVTLSSPSVLAYSRYAITTVTASKAAELYCLILPRSLAVTPSYSVVTTTGLSMVATKDTTYSLNITALSPTTEYVLYIAGREPFGPEIATPIADTRTSFTTVNDGDKPSEGKQCPRGWNLSDGLLMFTQCSDHGICVDSQCSCYSPYSGESCSVIQGEKMAVNATHSMLHTRFTITGDLPDSEEDQDVFLQTTLQLATAEVLDLTPSSVQIRLWEKTSMSSQSTILRGIKFSHKHVRQQELPLFHKEMHPQELPLFHKQIKPQELPLFHKMKPQELPPLHKQMHPQELPLFHKQVHPQELSLSSKRLHRRGILPYLDMQPQEANQGGLYVHMTINTPKERAEAIMEDVTQFLKSTELVRVFHVLDLSVRGVEIDKVLIQDNSDPFTCYNNRLDDDETDVDCGGSSCSSRCPASAKCVSDSDCDAMSCFRGKCTNINWMRIFYIAGIAVAVIVVIAVISVCVAAIRKKKNTPTTVTVPLPTRQDYHASSYSKRHHSHLHH